MAENKYDVAVRSILRNADKPDELVVQRFESMTADEVKLWVWQTATECKAVLNWGEYPDPNVTEEEITRQFNEVISAVDAFEKSHETKSMTFKIMNGYVTVQVIYPKEKST